MSNRITIDELASYLWQSAVLLRTNIDAGAYKQYIFPLLFFKRICDVYDEETEAAKEKYGDDIEDFAEEELLGYIGSTPVYIQQRVTPFYSHYETIESDEYNSDRGVTTRKKCKEMECFCFNETWIADFFDAYGEKEFKRLSGFLDKFDIGDLRCANIGYIDGRPILFDYAGYNEW